MELHWSVRLLKYASVGSVLALLAIVRQVQPLLVDLLNNDPSKVRFLVLAIMALGGMMGPIIMFLYQYDSYQDSQPQPPSSPRWQRISQISTVAAPLLAGLSVLLILTNPPEVAHRANFQRHLDQLSRHEQAEHAKLLAFRAMMATGIVNLEYRDRILYSTMALRSGGQEHRLTLGFLGQIHHGP